MNDEEPRGRPFHVGLHNKENIPNLLKSPPYKYILDLIDRKTVAFCAASWGTTPTKTDSRLDSSTMVLPSKVSSTKRAVAQVIWWMTLGDGVVSTKEICICRSGILQVSLVASTKIQRRHQRNYRRGKPMDHYQSCCPLLLKVAVCIYIAFCNSIEHTKFSVEVLRLWTRDLSS